MKKKNIIRSLLAGFFLISIIGFNTGINFRSQGIHFAVANAQSTQGCISRDHNDGKCFFDGTTYFCGKHFLFHNCMLGIYPQ